METPAVATTTRLVVVTGPAPEWVRPKIEQMLDDLLNGLDRTVSFEDFDGTTVEAARAAALTPSMFTPRRIIRLRDVKKHQKAVEVLITDSGTFDPDVTVLIEWISDKAPVKLARLIADSATSEMIEVTAPRNSRERRSVVAAAAANSGLKLDGTAIDALSEALGNDVHRAVNVLETLRVTHGDGAAIDATVAGTATEGAVGPAELAGAMDAGSVPAAHQALHRLLGPGAWAPLQLLAWLRARYSGAWRHTNGVRAGSPWQQKQADQLARKWGPDRLEQAMTLIAAADGDLKGRSGWSDQLVCEVLIARLTRLGAASRTR